MKNIFCNENTLTTYYLHVPILKKEIIELTGNKDYSLFILGLTPTLVIRLLNSSTNALLVLSGSAHVGKYCWALAKVRESGLL